LASADENPKNRWRQMQMTDDLGQGVDLEKMAQKNENYKDIRKWRPIMQLGWIV
jgi:hypothetical protein